MTMKLNTNISGKEVNRQNLPFLKHSPNKVAPNGPNLEEEEEKSSVLRSEENLLESAEK